MEILLSLLPILLLEVPLLLWVLMIVHATKNPIPNKPVWLLVLILAGVLGAAVYYFAVYKDMSKKKGQGISKRTFLITVSILLVLIACVFIATPPASQLKEVPLSEVIRQANSGEIKTIKVNGNELKITKYGEAGPTERSRKEKGSSLYEQGLTNKNVQLYIRD